MMKFGNLAWREVGQIKEVFTNDCVEIHDLRPKKKCLPKQEEKQDSLVPPPFFFFFYSNTRTQVYETVVLYLEANGRFKQNHVLFCLFFFLKK